MIILLALVRACACSRYWYHYCGVPLHYCSIIHPHFQCFFVTVWAGTAYRKIWRLVNNFFARIIRFTVQKFQLFWVIFCIIIFFIELWHILVLWLAKMPNGGMPVFTLIAAGWRYRKIFFYKKSTAYFCGRNTALLQLPLLCHCLLTRHWSSISNGHGRNMQ